MHVELGSKVRVKDGVHVLEMSATSVLVKAVGLWVGAMEIASAASSEGSTVVGSGSNASTH
jgi:hypothetical protein